MVTSAVLAVRARPVLKARATSARANARRDCRSTGEDDAIMRYATCSFDKPGRGAFLVVVVADRRDPVHRAIRFTPRPCGARARRRDSIAGPRGGRTCRNRG